VVKNDILVVSMTGTIGKVSFIIQRIAAINQNLVKLTANTDIILVNYPLLYILISVET
jgi:hypothetical protein